MRRIIITTVSILSLALLGAWFFSDVQVLKRRCAELTDLLSIESVNGGPLRQAKVYSLNKLLAENVTIETKEIQDLRGSFDRQEIESGFSWILNNAKESKFQIDEYLNIDVINERGVTTLAVEGFMEFPTYRPADGRFEVEIEWMETEEGWKFDRVSWKPLSE